MNALQEGELYLIFGAAVNKTPDSIKLLAAADANPNVTDADGSVPLCYAVSAGKTANVEALLTAGADAKQYCDGKTKLMKLAKKTKNKDIVRLLKAAK